MTRISDLSNILAANGWHIEEETREEVRARPPRGVALGWLLLYGVVFTLMMGAGLLLAAEANRANVSVEQLADYIDGGQIDGIIREGGEYIITLTDGTRLRYLDPGGTLPLRLEREGIPPETFDALPIEVRSEGRRIFLLERLLFGIVPLTAALALLFGGGLLILMRLTPARSRVFSLDSSAEADDAPTLIMRDRRGTWALDDEAEFRRIVRRRPVAGRVVLVVWVIVVLMWCSVGIMAAVVIAGNA